MKLLEKAREHRAKARRRRAINDLITSIDVDERAGMAPLVPLFSDDRINFLKKIDIKRLSLKEWLALLDSDEHKEFSALQFLVGSFIQQDPETGIRDLSELAQIMQSIQQELDPDRNLYPDADYLVPRIVLGAAKNSAYEHVELTRVEKKRLLEVAFLTQSKSADSYVPTTRSSKYGSTNINVFTTEQILAHPEKSALTHVEERARNIQRLEAITQLLNGDVSHLPQLSAYPEEFIDELAKLESSGQNDLLQSALGAVHFDASSLTPELIQEAFTVVQSINIADLQDIHLTGTVLKTVDTHYPQIQTSEQREALLSVILAIYRKCADHETRKYFDADDRLLDQRVIDMLIAQPEQSLAMVDMIIDRNTFDYDQFIVSIDIQTFKSGAL